ncbi:hypothetical protein Fcan01_16885 [Folsomia candida]|uniref:F-box domain-containing protein n=1 Tax=Folsomia candida TaxID=158441 RepID=A0A226DRN2_FOLCA|nr:hypothetical protein Fcan01_16885 [Folsomia candida]
METPQDLALNNPIILTEILKQTSIPLRNARLVCKFWNDIVLSLPNRRLAFSLRDEYTEDDEQEDTYLKTDPFHFFGICSTLDKRLAKRISATFDTCEIDEFETLPCYIYYFGAKLMNLCDKFNDIVQILEITIYSHICFKYIYQALQNSCPNLTELRITCDIRSFEIPHNQPRVLTAKPRLTLFALNCNMSERDETPSFLNSFSQAVVNVAANLREVTLPWGCHPDLSPSKCLDSLRIALGDEFEEKDIVHFQVSDLSRMLNQVTDQLVALSIMKGSGSWGYFKPGTWNRIPFSLPRPMPKLKTYRNMMVDIFECTDILKDIEKMPGLKNLVLGKTGTIRSTCLHEMLETICNSGKILGNVTTVTIIEMHDPTLLEGIKTAFPNLESLALNTYNERDYAGAVSGMELGVVLKACTSELGRLKHLSIRLPSYPEQMMDVIKALLDSRDLYQGLKTFKLFETRFNTLKHDLTEDEMDLFKQLLLAMNVMDKVTIWNFGEESMRNILTFMTSEKLPVSKFMMFGGWAYRATDRD